MPTAIFALLTAVALAACTLTDAPPGLPTAPPSLLPITTTPQPELNQPTALPGVVPTRTLPGFSGSAGTLALTPGALPAGPTGESGRIDSPAPGSAVPAGVLQVSGVVAGLDRDEFTLVLVDGAGGVLNSQLITLQNPNNVHEIPWSAAMTTGAYTGPAEVQVLGRTPAGQDVLLARANVILVDAGARAPAARQQSQTPYAAISSPADGAVVSGAVIQVQGVAGGIQANQFTLLLVAPGGSVLNTRLITLNNTDYTIVVPWAASLGTSGYRGPADIHVSAGSGMQTTLASVRVTLQ